MFDGLIVQQLKILSVCLLLKLEMPIFRAIPKLWHFSISWNCVFILKDNSNLAYNLTIILHEPKTVYHSIGPGQPAHPYSLTRLYTVGWPTLSSELDIP